MNEIGTNETRLATIGEVVFCVQMATESKQESGSLAHGCTLMSEESSSIFGPGEGCLY